MIVQRLLVKKDGVRPRSSQALFGVLSFVFLLTESGVALAQATAPLNSPGLEEVVVFGRAEQLIGTAGAASEGAVAGDDLLVRPMLRVADLLEAVPGMIAAQHSGSGKANQYFLRGFNLDHGTDFTTYIDDVPWNLRTHGHGQGYLDVNGLIPEIVERIDYRKGTYRALSGDFSIAGSSHMTSIKALSEPFIALETGSYGWGRAAGGGTTDVGDGQLTLIGQYKTYDGPWELPENLKHESLWGKYSESTDYGTWAVSLSGYSATWHPTEQTPESAFGTPDCKDEFCSLDPSAYGKTERWILTSNWLGDDWRATLYGQHYDWHMLSNPTYTDDGQINQFDRRNTFGGRYEQQLTKSEPFELLVGTEWRYDQIGKVGLDATEQGHYIGNISNNAINEGSLGVYAEATWRPFEKLRLTSGLRGDAYDFDVSTNANSGPANTGHETDTIASPKLGAAYVLSDKVELYANWGQGFHSNDARGVFNKEVQVPGLVRGTGYESGVRFEQGKFQITATYWWLNLDSELIFVGDSNSVEPKGGAKRQGYELVAFWHPVSWLGIDAVYTGSRARNSDPEEAGGEYVEGAVENAGEIGVAATRNGWEISARLRYLGPYPLLPDNSERAQGETMLNLRLAYEFETVTVYGEVLNVLDRRGKDIVYFYENEFDPQGGRVSRAEEPRSIRAGLKYKF
jgi:outer membrane receptor protein involved in Fe transport